MVLYLEKMHSKKEVDITCQLTYFQNNLRKFSHSYFNFQMMRAYSQTNTIPSYSFSVYMYVTTV